MNKEKIRQQIKNLKHKITQYLLRTGIVAVSAFVPAHSSAKEAKFAPNESPVNRSLSAENIIIIPEAVNIADSSQNKPVYEFENKAFDQNNNEIKDFANVTKYSLWDCSYKREVGNESNPVGVARTFYGSLQFNRFNAENMAIFGLLSPNYEKLASKFFVKKAGFNDAVENFKKSAEKYGNKFGDANLVYHVGSSARQKLVQYIAPDFKTLFQKEGLANAQQFLNLQRAYASAVYCSFDAKNLNKIVDAMEKSNIRPEQVNPAIWGMFLAKHIKGGFGKISNLIQGKTLEQINSLQFVNEMANSFPDVFKQASGIEAWKFAQKHYSESHSITTTKELSVILNRPEILNNYLKFLAYNQNGTINFEQAQELMPHTISQRLKITERPGLTHLIPQKSDTSQIKTPKLLKNKTFLNPTMKDVIKSKKSKSR